MKSIVDNHTGTHDMEWYLERIEYLAGFMTTEREQTLRDVLDQRTRYMTICMENTFHPQNASALIRHCDAFGLQDIYTIEEVCKFRPNVNIVKGTDKWVTFNRSTSTGEAITSLRERGYRIIATTPHSGDCSPESFDVADGPFALVFGTEHEGISQEVVDAADGFIKIPMWGFVESLNVSASAAILIYMLSQKVREKVFNWGLSEEEKAAILLDWMKKSIKDSTRILNRYQPITK